VTSPRLACAIDAVVQRWSPTASPEDHAQTHDLSAIGPPADELLTKLIDLSQRPLERPQARQLLDGLLQVEVQRLLQAYARLSADDDDDDDHGDHPSRLHAATASP
jgi:hypothetical protein